MRSHRLGRGISKLAKATVLLVVFLFTLTPFAPVQAQESKTSPAPEVTRPAADDPIITPPARSNKDKQTPLVEKAPEDQVLPDTKPATDISKDPKDTSKNPKDNDKKLASPKSQATLSGTTNPLVPFQSPTSDTNSKQFIPTPDSSTGATVYNYPIVVPPGRNGMQPDLKLQYNSQNKDQNSIFGLGWSLNIPYISRVNKKGSSTLYTDNYFTSSISGDLINTTGPSYVSKVENGDFLKYTYSSNTWTVVDKTGMIYTFGSAAATRQDNPSDSTKIYKWMLEKVQDTNGNFISYTYYKNGGQIYPDTVTYTSNGANTGIFSVVFTHVSRTDAVTNSTPGFKTTTGYRISQIQTFMSSAWLRTYALTYSSDSPSTQSLLASITESGQEGGVTTTLPAATFQYQDINPGGWGAYSSSWSMPADKWEIDYAAATSVTAPTVNGHPIQISFDTARNGSDASKTSILSDVNGDGLPDAIQSYRATYYNLDKTYVYLNTGSGWVYSSSWSIPSDQWEIDYAAAAGTTPLTSGGNPVKISFDTARNGSDASKTSVLADVNGDGLPDAIQSYRATYYNLDKTYIYINNGSGWVYNSSWTTPADQWEIDYATATSTTAPTVSGHPLKISFDSARNGTDTSKSTSLVDVNGDGLVDAVQSYRATYYNLDKTYVYINNGTGWVYDSSWTTPADQWEIDYAAASGSSPLTSGGNSVRVSFDTSRTSDASKRAVLVDVNGDGLVDAVQSYRSAYYNLDKTYVYINTGAGWIYDSSWSTAADQWEIDYAAASGSTPLTSGGQSIKFSFDTIQSGNDSSKTSVLSDVNGDGLPDAVQSYRSAYYNLDKTYVYINTGTGWVYSSAWSTPADRWEIDYATATSTAPPTVNGHALQVSFDTARNGNDASRSTMLADVNGDGMQDGVQSYRAAYYNMDKSYIYLNSGSHPLLTTITLPEGGSYSMSYKSTTQYVDGSSNLLNPNTPFIVQTLNQVTINNGSGLTGTTTYSYAGGKYYYDSTDLTTRKFAGFATITKTDPSGNTTKIFYHQGDSSDTIHGEYSDEYWKIGQSYRVEMANSSGNIYSKTINKWDSYTPSTGRRFVKLAQILDMTYDGDSSHKDKAESYTYDNIYGNLTQKIESGEVTGSDNGTYTDIGTDDFTTAISYAANTTPYIMGLPSQQTVTDHSATKVKESKYYYDSQTLGNVTIGNLTKREDWKSGSTYVNIQKTYDTTYGIVTQDKDARGKNTNYTYDSYNLYPATATNPLSQVTSYTYDYSSGKANQVTDSNTRVYQTVFDGLDRPIAQKQPDIASPGTLVNKSTYTYTDTSGAMKVQKTDYLDGSNTVDSYTYFDGLGRPIQARKEMEASGTFAVTDTIYNNMGQVYKDSLPYSSSGNAKTAATTTSSLLNTYSYDPMGRITSTVNATGTSSNTYSDWKLTVTDPNGKTKDLYKDAYGNLIKVDEHNGASTYSTNYLYNGNNNLTRITDALGNVRNFTYDGIGRRLTAQDLHASSDATFGTYTYTYDDNGNTTSIVDPKSQTINYTYDDLSRPATEDYTGQVGTEVTYTYDSGTDGVGKLTSVTAPGVSTTYTYDANGNHKQEVKTLNSTGYQTNYTYDRLGNQLTITNPDNSQVKYSYNTAGQLETVQRKESTDASFINVVTNFDYGPHGKVTSETFQNGTATTNTYDSAKLYRLSNRLTTFTGGSKAQDLSYTYDNNGNITKVIDASNTNSSKTVDYTYDDLNRLLSASASAVASGQTTYSHSYTYDAIGNILTRTDASGTYSYSGSGFANPHAVTSIGSINYSYDNNGNMRTQTGGLSNTWDYNNRLTQAVKGGITSTYAYDQSGQRVKLSNGSTTTYYPSQNYNTDGSTIMKNVFAGGQLVATIKGTGAVAAVFSVHTDQLSGSNVVTNSTRTQEELMDYFPYGNIRLDQKAGSFNEKRKFTGYEHDDDTGLDYANARYYSAAIGRFISQDPAFWDTSHLSEQLVNPQSWNSYSYVDNNPIINTDPDGKFGVQDLKNVWFGFGNAVASNNLLGLGRQEPSNSYYQNGQRLGDVSSLIQGSYEVATGIVAIIGGAAGGIATSETGVGAVAGTGVSAWGVAAAGHGSAVAGTAIFNLKNAGGVSSGNNWGNPRSLNRHFNDHGADFGATSAQDYASKANDFKTYAENNKEVQMYRSKDGVIRYYDKQSNTFGVYNKNGTTATYFKPQSGTKYIHNQLTKGELGGFIKR